VTQASKVAFSQYNRVSVRMCICRVHYVSCIFLNFILYGLTCEICDDYEPELRCSPGVASGWSPSPLVLRRVPRGCFRSECCAGGRLMAAPGLKLNPAPTRAEHEAGQTATTISPVFGMTPTNSAYQRHLHALYPARPLKNLF